MKSFLLLLTLVSFGLLTEGCQDTNPEQFVGTWQQYGKKGTIVISERDGILFVGRDGKFYPGLVSGKCIVMKNEEGEERKLCLQGYGDSTLVTEGGQGQLVFIKLQ